MTAVILTVVNVEIASKERIVRDGTIVLLRIAPRDPRSLLQGDYMALRYTMVDDVAREAKQSDLDDGVAIIELDKHNEATFVALYDGQPLEPGQHLLRYRKRGESVRLGSDAYFFEEGTGEDYSSARFGEIRLNAKGDSVLTGLRDESGEPLGRSLHI
ncbi:MAG: GDYXXLXY domain-containing protein [Gammaproteobacteria bacterium]|nr:GDYXXLXY domain-containing protein [Gammaproteobacteria bacterium]